MKAMGWERKRVLGGSWARKGVLVMKFVRKVKKARVVRIDCLGGSVLAGLLCGACFLLPSFPLCSRTCFLLFLLSSYSSTSPNLLLPPPHLPSLSPQKEMRQLTIVIQT